MPKRLGVAVLGAATLLGREVVEGLHRRGFPLGELRLFDRGEFLGEGFETGEIVEDIEEARGQFDVVFCAAELGEDVFSRFEAAAFVDCTGRFALASDVPLVVPEWNPGALAALGSRRIVSSPDPVALALTVVLGPVRSVAGLRRVVATTIEPVSERGREGIEELERQAADLLSGREPRVEVFPHRVCFNVVPFSAGGAEKESEAAAQLRKLLGEAELPVSLTRTYGSLFYGTGISLHVELAENRPLGEIREVLRQAPGVLWTEELGLESSVAEALEHEATLVSRLREEGERSYALWVAVDNLRKGRALNAVQIAEILARERF
ncbi:MAG: aspartate-semialdehyde dehydrogenase [Candidatus Binatia bacterium]|nr:MAG: aspartate-semialdehyde dehydrogenase [Candidatus Binatia bacterium]